MLNPNDITRAVFSHLESVAGLPDIYYVDSTETATDDHINAFIIEAKPNDLGIAYNSTVMQSGILQLNLSVVASPRANIEGGDYVSIIAAAFPKGLRLSGVQFDKSIIARSPIAMNGFSTRIIDLEYTILD